ncbi:MAG: Crp/Fnr family transcriptional regulator [Alphaproteobacteria bacterium]|jgi:CRP/FNR family transcriptional regulator
MANKIVSTETMARAGRALGVRPIKAARGAALFRNGDPCQGFLALERGLIKVTMCSASGREIVLYRVQPGEICLQTFTCLVQHRAYGAEGVVEEDIEALLIPPDAFEGLMTQDAAFRGAVLNSVAERFVDFERTVEALAFTGLEQRLAAALMRLIDEDGVAHLTHEALAIEIGSAREAVGRQLSIMARQGIVVLSRGKVEVVRKATLKSLAEAM